MCQYESVDTDCWLSKLAEDSSERMSLMGRQQSFPILTPQVRLPARSGRSIIAGRFNRLSIVAAWLSQEPTERNRQNKVGSIGCSRVDVNRYHRYR